jgi:hypothetical protein
MEALVTAPGFRLDSENNADMAIIVVHRHPEPFMMDFEIRVIIGD